MHSKKNVLASHDGMINLLDVGSSGGLSPHWQANKHIIQNLVSFDPLTKPFIRKLPHGLHVHFSCGISQDKGKYPFNIYSKPACSSFFLRNDKIVDAIPEYDINKLEIDSIIDVKCFRLDSILEKSRFKFDFIKIDTQGMDLEVIKSMGDYIDDMMGIQIEIFLLPLYIGVPLFDEVDKHLDLLDFKRVGNVRRPNPLFGDYIYIKKGGDQKKLDTIEKIYTRRIK